MVSGRNAAELDAYAVGLSERTGRTVVGLAADLAEPDAAERLADQAWSVYGGPDVLVNNAGMSITGSAAGVRPRTGTRCWR